MASLTNGFEGGTAGVTITAGNSGGTSGDAWTLSETGTGSTCVYSSSGQAHGSVCMHVTTGATNTTERRGWSVNAGDTAADQWFRFYIDPGNVTGTVSPLRGAPSGGVGQRFRVQVTSAGQVTFRNTTNATLWTSSPNLTAGKQWRVECRVAGSTTGAARIWVYDGDATTAAYDSGELSGDFAGPIREVWFGQTASGTNIAVKVDDCGWSDTAALGPAVTVTSGTASGATGSTSTVEVASGGVAAGATAGSAAGQVTSGAAVTVSGGTASTSVVSVAGGAGGVSVHGSVATSSVRSVGPSGGVSTGGGDGGGGAGASVTGGAGSTGVVVDVPVSAVSGATTSTPTATVGVGTTCAGNTVDTGSSAVRILSSVYGDTLAEVTHTAAGVATFTGSTAGLATAAAASAGQILAVLLSASTITDSGELASVIPGPHDARDTTDPVFAVDTTPAVSARRTA